MKSPTVPFLDLARLHASIQDELDVAYRRVTASGQWVLGEEVEAFEREFAAYCGAAHCIGVSNGLDALQMILRGYGIGHDDEVIVPATTFIATWFAVSHVGARPVPVESRQDTFNIDPARIEAAITPRTRAIIAVHLFGCPADMAAINGIAQRRGLLVIEDAAQAHGALLGTRRAGALGHAAAFSFYPGKNLGALGDGGAVVTADGILAQRIRMLRNYGSAKKYEHQCQGFNTRLDELQAAFLRAKLPNLDRWNALRRDVARCYLRGIRNPAVELPVVEDREAHAWHLFVVRSRARDALRVHLQAAGIATQIHYPRPPHLQDAYAAYNEDFGALPVAEQIGREVLSLPMDPLMTPEQIAWCVRQVNEFRP